MDTEYIKNYNLDSKEIKDKIFNYLYSSGIKTEVKYELIDQKKLDDIKNNGYIICPKFSGVPTWILIFHINNNYYAVNFPKHNKKKREDIKIHPINVGISKDLYRGTIMEGIFYQIDQNKFIVINEVYKLSGEDQLLSPKNDRLNNLMNKIKISINQTPNYQINVNSYYEIDKNSIEQLYNKIKEDEKIQELIFFPKNYGKKIYHYTILESDLIDNVIKISEFYLHKTNKPDVYDLLTKNNEKFDIAYIPSIDISLQCQEWFKLSKSHTLLVKCQFDNNKNKWFPIDLV